MELAEKNFKKEVLQSDLPVLVDFFATWCGPCRMQGPIIEELAEEYRNKAKVVKVDIDNCPKVASQYQITSIPTLILFNHGQIVEKITGLLQKKALTEKLDNLIK